MTNNYHRAIYKHTYIDYIYICPGVWGYPVWPELPAYSPETLLQPDQDDKYQDPEYQGGGNYP